MATRQVSTCCHVHGPAEALAAFEAAMIRRLPAPQCAEDRMPQGLPLSDPEVELDFNGVLPMPGVLRGTVLSGEVLLALYALGKEGIEGGPDEPIRPLRYDWVQARGIRTREDLLAYQQRNSPDSVLQARQCILAHEQTGHAVSCSWALETWGTPWTAYDLEVLSEAPEDLHLRFRTAEAFPRPVFRALAAAHPSLAFRCAWVDETGVTGGRAVFGAVEGGERFDPGAISEPLLDEVLGPLPPALRRRAPPMPERPVEPSPPPAGKHTPPPWHRGEGNGTDAIFAEEGRMRFEDRHGTVLYPVCTMVTGWEAGEDEANANLVSAAPELLAALRALAERMEQTGRAAGNPLDARLTERARAAIANAEGRTGP